MKQKNRIIMQYFLKVLYANMGQRSVITISSFWLTVFDTDELKIIVVWFLNLGTVEELDSMSDHELLEIIGDDKHILRYLLVQMETELSHMVEPTQESVFETLQQLEMTSHYLSTVPLDLWDERDKSIYQSLCVKAGKPVPFYGIFKSVEKEGDPVNFNSIGKIYDSPKKAEEILSMLIDEKAFQGDDLKIMML